MTDADPTHLDLLIIGAGTGNTILTPEFDDWRVGIVERDLFGGTCMNRGCVPTKMFVHTADLAQQTRDLERFGLDGGLKQARWPDVVDRIFDRIDPIAPAGEEYREEQPNVTVIRGDARFVEPRVIEVDGHRWTADQIVLAAGARPVVPDIEGLDDVDYETSDTLMRRDDLPEHLIVLGGGYIAAELAHVVGAMGTRVTIVLRGDRMLRYEDEAVSERITEVYRDRFDLVTDAPVERVEQDDHGTITVHLGGEAGAVTGDALLVATGRVPNGEQLGVELTGATLDDQGYIRTDDYLRTDAEGVWALGDITNHQQLKHLANAQGRALAHNLVHPGDLRPMPTAHIPHAVFSGPQIASVGATQQALEAAGREFLVGTQAYGDVAYGWAMEDTGSFCKVLADPENRLLLGAHIIGPHAASLIQQLIQGMEFDLTVDEMARGQLFIHPAMSEVVENALLQL